jgi:aminoglycoside 6-adenylyltransferase
MLIGEETVLDTLIAWGHREPAVRAMILTSSRARPGGQVDAFSDYDVILAVNDPMTLARDLDWQSEIGRPMVRWGDQGELQGVTTYFRGVIYEDGTKIDYTIWPVELDPVSHQGTLPEMLDVGYRVLLDADRRTAAWPPPTYRAHIPGKPTQDEYAPARSGSGGSDQCPDPPGGGEAHQRVASWLSRGGKLTI